MRTKRSKDTRLVDKFSKRREDMATESRLQHPAKPAKSFTHPEEEEDEEEEALEVQHSGGIEYNC